MTLSKPNYLLKAPPPNTFTVGCDIGNTDDTIQSMVTFKILSACQEYGIQDLWGKQSLVPEVEQKSILENNKTKLYCWYYRVIQWRPV